MKKVSVVLIVMALTISMVFAGFGCKTTEAAPETTEAEETTEEVADSGDDELDPEIAAVWAIADQFRRPVSPDFKGPNGETVTLDTESLPLTVAEVKKIQEGNYKIAVSWNSLDSEYFETWRRGTIAACEYLNIEIVAEATANFDATKQLSDVETFIALKPDAIIAAPLDPVTAAAAFRPAIDAGIKLAFVSTIPDGYVKGEDHIGVTTSSCYDYGFFAFEILYDLLGSGGKLAAMPWETNYWFTNYYDEIFFKYVDESDLDLVAKEGYATIDDAYAVANGIILNHPEIKGLYVDYCTPGFGAANALKDNDREDVGLVVMGYDEPTLLAIIDGSFAGALSDVTFLVGYNAVLLACYGFLEKEGPEYAVCPAVKITKENMREIFSSEMGSTLSKEVDNALKDAGY